MEFQFEQIINVKPGKINETSAFAFKKIIGSDCSKYERFAIVIFHNKKNKKAAVTVINSADED